MARDGKGDKKRIREALTRTGATELQCRMAWILYAVNGVTSALRFVRQVASAR